MRSPVKPGSSACGGSEVESAGFCDFCPSRITMRRRSRIGIILLAMGGILSACKKGFFLSTFLNPFIGTFCRCRHVQYPAQNLDSIQFFPVEQGVSSAVLRERREFTGTHRMVGRGYHAAKIGKPKSGS